MKTIIHRAEDRGFANHGWLQANHSFSFASWYNPEKVHFGALRVLNDDIIAPGQGFGTHSYKDMEIVSIPLKGGLAHRDSTGSEGVIYPNDVQVMSAGTGILHSEFNHSKDEKSNFLQLCIFPDKKGHKPRYDQMTFNPEERINKLQTIVSPDKANGNLWLNQDAYLSMANIDKNNHIDYKFRNKANGVYIFLIEGNVSVADETLSERDGI